MPYSRANLGYPTAVVTTSYDPEARGICFLAAVRYAGDRSTTPTDLAAAVGLRVRHMPAGAPELMCGDASLDLVARVIYVREGLTPVDEGWLILHELGHFDARHLGLDYETEERHADVFADTVAYWLDYSSIDSPRL